MIRVVSGVMVPAFVASHGADPAAPAVAPGLDARVLVIPARVACDASGRCYFDLDAYN